MHGHSCDVTESSNNCPLDSYNSILYCLFYHAINFVFVLSTAGILSLTITCVFKSYYLVADCILYCMQLRCRSSVLG